MINILFLNHTSKLGGAELGLMTLIREIDKSRFNVFVILGEDGRLFDLLKTEDTTVKVLSLYKRILNRRKAAIGIAALFDLPAVFHFFIYVAKIRKFVNMNNIDVIFTNSLKSFFYGSFVSLFTRKPLVWYLHDILSSEHFTFVARRLILILSSSADIILCISQAVKGSLLRIDDKRCFVFYYPFDFKRLAADTDLNKIKSELGIGVDEKVISLIGRISPWKGQDVFIKASSIVDRTFGKVRFLIVGDALFGEEEYKNHLFDLVKDLDVRDKIIFTGYRDDIGNILSISDIVVHTSTKEEPFGRIVIEAMASGKPVIATTRGGHREIMTAKMGMLIEPNDTRLLAEKISFLLSDSQAAESFGKEARETALRRFDAKRTIRDVEQIVLAVLKNR